MAGDCVTFGFTEIGVESERGAGDSVAPTPRSIRTPDADKLKSRQTVERNVGLGSGPGGQIARSFLSEKGNMILDPLMPIVRGQRGGLRNVHGPPFEPKVPEVQRGLPASLSEGPEPQGMFLALLLNDMTPPSEQDLTHVCEHRWTFHGALDWARQGRGFCFFVWCLLDLQRNVQLEEEGDALDPKLASACKTFVGAQCREGKAGGMYQLLTHFISNSLVFYEWDRFLRKAFEDQRAGQEGFLVPHLEQVWGRFCRFAAILEGIFDMLNTRFVWRHRLPKAGDLVLDHMKRRCFSSDTILKNELFTQTACRNETIKAVKYAFSMQ